MKTETTTAATQTVPDLEPHCGSWIVVSRETGRPVFETYERGTSEAINQERYEVVTAYQWLVRFNQHVERPVAQEIA